jgi:hypothetical protein
MRPRSGIGAQPLFHRRATLRAGLSGHIQGARIGVGHRPRARDRFSRGRGRCLEWDGTGAGDPRRCRQLAARRDFEDPCRSQRNLSHRRGSSLAGEYSLARMMPMRGSCGNLQRMALVSYAGVVLIHYFLPGDITGSFVAPARQVQERRVLANGPARAYMRAPPAPDNGKD